MKERVVNMRSGRAMRFTLLATIVALGLVSCQKSAKESTEAAVSGSILLFNGRDLDGWGHVLVGDDVKKEDVWSVRDGVLVCKGQPNGYLFTKESYQDFALTFEWRWPEGKEPGNSGVLLRIAGEPTGFMPKCVEAQLKNGSAGDIWAFFGAKVKGGFVQDALRELRD